jgi:aspartate carbamoyltransferase catalytic subunit
MSTQAAHRKDLLQIRGLSAAEITAILDEARRMREVSRRADGRRDDLAGRLVVLLFLEASTRTLTSFDLAAKRLGADTVSISKVGSSMSKGESLIDTVRTVDAMRPSAVIVRDSASGSPRIVAANTRAAVVNGGDGQHEHPTQALLDALTILDHKERIAGLRVAVVGDIRHSRVARSNAHLLATLGAHVVFAGPRSLLPEGIEQIAAESEGTVTRAGSVDEAVEGADVVMMLRIQLERQQEAFFPSLKEYHAGFGLTAERLERARPDAIVMHPGPVNRDVELASELMDGPRSVILEQVANGVAVRMAVLSMLATRVA